jgi:hypothetical protein
MQLFVMIHIIKLLCHSPCKIYGVYIKHLLKIYNKTKTTTKMINIFFDWIHKNVKITDFKSVALP